ncbi:Zinc metalloproteinase nas-4 [Trichinella zimbabwensis]|uniref:Cytoplasmic tRNA 2-thiolation protein 2 n=1 Tax=Trichinella zimbabwensis TaxID=268475 RepID=A0A0V1HMX6_9BILA|nr:Zinc metalloproteinase nas-4 [Trichinella zimbabwensis]
MKEEKIDTEKIIEILRLRINEENISTVCPLLVENLRQLQNVVGLDAEFASNFVDNDGLNLFLDLFKNICEMKSLLKDDYILLKRCFQCMINLILRDKKLGVVFWKEFRHYFSICLQSCESVVIAERCSNAIFLCIQESERVEDIFEDGCDSCIKLLTNCLIRSKQNCCWCTWIVDKVLTLPSSLIYLFSLFEAVDDRVILLGQLNSEDNLHHLDQSNKKYLSEFFCQLCRNFTLQRNDSSFMVLFQSTLAVLCSATSDEEKISENDPIKCDSSVLEECTKVLFFIQQLNKSGDEMFAVSKEFDALFQNRLDDSHSANGIKCRLVRLIANICYQNKHNCELAGKLGVVQLLLDCTVKDARNFLITEWATFAIRNLLKEKKCASFLNYFYFVQHNCYVADKNLDFECFIVDAVCFESCDSKFAMKDGGNSERRLCVKCSNLGEVILHEKDVFCRRCFKRYCLHKFRLSLGRYRLFRNNETALIYLDGSASSVFLFRIVTELVTRTDPKKMLLRPIFVHIIESGNNQSGCKDFQALIDLVHSNNFKLNLFSLADIYQKSFSEVSHCQQWKDDQEKIDILFQHCSSATVKLELLQRLKTMLLYKIARYYETCFVMLSCNSTLLSGRVLSHIAQGRGDQIPDEVAVIDKRWPGVQFLRPLCELSEPEICFYNYFFNNGCISFPSVMTLTNHLLEEESIQRESKLFIHELQSKFTSTVSTVFSSVSKLPSVSSTSDQVNRCKFCYSILDQLCNFDEKLSPSEFYNMKAVDKWQFIATILLISVIYVTECTSTVIHEDAQDSLLKSITNENHLTIDDFITDNKEGSISTKRTEHPLKILEKYGNDIAGIAPGRNLKLITNHKSHGKNFISRTAIKGMEFRWPNGVVPYILSDKYGKKSRKIIARAMQMIQEQTCIRFVPNKKHKYRDYVNIEPIDGCYSYIGRVGGEQPISLTSNCIQEGVIIHELLHALGFIHEQSRSDRDKYVRILWQNIMPGMESEFEKYSDQDLDNLGFEYDYDSIMHYEKEAFSRNGRATLIPLKSGSEQMGQRDGLSGKDILKINKLYACNLTIYGTSNGRSDENISTNEIVQPTVLPNSFFCQDFNGHCPMWKSENYCHSLIYHAFMVVTCPLSCAFC